MTTGEGQAAGARVAAVDRVRGWLAAMEAGYLYPSVNGGLQDDLLVLLNCYTRAQAQLELLKDPVAVHRSMLAGGIAKPSWENIKHLYPLEVQKEFGGADA